MTTRAFLVAVAIILELLAVYLFRAGGQPAVAAAHAPAPGLEALPDAYGMRLLAIHPRSGIKPSAYSLASVQLRNFATQVGVSLRGGAGDHVLPLTKGLSGADGQGGLRSGAWGDAHRG